MRYKGLAFLLSCVGALAFAGSQSASAATTMVNVDGLYSDWDSIAKTSIGSSNLAITGTGSHVYFYVDASKQSSAVKLSDYNVKIGSSTYKISLSGSGENYILQGQDQTTGNSATLNDIGAAVVKDNKIEADIDLTKLPETFNGMQTLTILNDSLGSGEATSLNDISTTAATDLANEVAMPTLASGSSDTIADSSNVASATNSMTTSGITIDGNDSDWDNVAKIQTGYSGTNDVAVTTDSKHVYFYVNGTNSTSPVPQWTYTLTIGGNRYDVHLSGNGSDQYTVQAQDLQNWAQLSNIGTATLKNNVLEAQVNLSDLPESYSGTQTVSLSNSSLGSGTATNTGDFTTSALADAAAATTVTPLEKIQVGDTYTTADSSSTSSASSSSDSSSSSASSSAASSSDTASSAASSSSETATTDAKDTTSDTKSSDAKSTDGISIDGDYSDWANVDKTQVGYNGKDDVAVTSDGTNVYFYVDTTVLNSQELLQNWQNQFTLTIDGKPYHLSLSGTSGNLTVTATDSGYQPISGSVGSAVSTDGQIEASVSLASLGADFATKGQTIAISNTQIGAQSATGVISSSTNASVNDNQVADATKGTDSSSDSSSSSSGSSSSSESSASSTSDVNEDGTSNALDQAVSGDSDSSTETKNTDTNNVSGDLGINIDGDFNDWNDKTMTEVSWKGDNDNRELATLLADDKYVYFYVLMEPRLDGGYTNFQPSGYKLKVGNVIYDVSFNNGHTVNLANGSTQAVSVDVYNEHAGTDNSNAGEAYVGNTTIDQTAYEYIKDHGNGAVTVQTPSYQWEVRIPLKNLTSSSNETGQDISLTTTTIWTDTLHTSGGSTGPVVLASAGFLIAAITVLKTTGFKLKKRWF